MLRCYYCGHIFEEDEDYTKNVLIDSGPGYKYCESVYVCPNCNSEEIEEFTFPYDECAEELDNDRCDGHCENCKLAEQKEEEKDGED